jgi:uncharacterized membrane protein YhfC
MQTLIPNLTIASMGLSALIGLAIPVALYIILRKKGANHLPFWTGAVTFVLFALVLEQLVYSVLMKTPFWLTVSSNFWLLGIFGGFMAGFFEETGRYIAMKTVLRKKRANDYNGLMYGAGHGGIEAVILLSVTMIINVVFSLQTNAGQVSPFGTPEIAQQIANTPFWMMLVGALERISAVAIHVSLSVLVWFAAKDGKKFMLYPLAILLHLLVDAVAVILSRMGVNVWIIEGAVYVMAIAFVLLAVAVWKKNHAAPVEAAPAAEAAPEAEARA